MLPQCLLAPPYAGLTLWLLPLPAGSRQQHKQHLHHWLQHNLPRLLGGQVELQFCAGNAAQLRLDSQTLPLSLAYAGNAALVAINQRSSHNIGVDLVWQADSGDDALSVAKEFFPEAIVGNLARQAASTRQACFSQQWARLEAALKAAKLTLADAAQLTPAQWQRAVPLQGLPPGYAAAVALSGQC